MPFVFNHDKAMEEGRSFGDHALTPQMAIIIGGNAQVFGPFVDPERSGAGTYVGKPASFHYPDMQSDAIVDLASVRVTAELALLRYAKCAAVPVAGQMNQVKVSATCGGPRGIKVGDVVRIGDKEADIMALVAEEERDPAGNKDSLTFKILILSRNLDPHVRTAETVDVELCLALHDAEFDGVEVNGQFVTLPGDVKMMTIDFASKGKLVELPVVRAEIHIEYRVWHSMLADKVRTVSLKEDLDHIPGDDVPENDLKKAVSLAFTNSGGMPVAYIAVADPDDLESWLVALNKVRTGYGIVPCTDNPAVIAAVEDLVEHRSRAETGRECVAWFSLPTPTTVVVANAENSENFEPMLATVSQSVVEVLAGNARFMSLGVRVGDILRYGDGDYEEFVVADVTNEDALSVQGDILDSDVPVRVEVWRKLDIDDKAAAIANKAGAYNNKRIRAVWPNEVSDGHDILAGWHLCAALAGLRSGCAPHRDLTGVEIRGLADAELAEMFDKDQLDMMAECGAWIVVNSDSAVVTRQGLTTATLGAVTESNESTVTNLDSINRNLRDLLSRLLRITAVTKRFRSQIVQRMRTRLNNLAGRRAATISAQLVAGEIDVVRRHVYLENSLVLHVKLTVPLPYVHGLGLATADVHQKIIA